MEINRAAFVEDLVQRLRAAGVPNPEEVADQIGDRYVDLLEEKLREFLYGVSTPTVPRGILGASPVSSWRSVLRSGELVTDEMRADVCYPNHRVGGRE